VGPGRKKRKEIRESVPRRRAPVGVRGRQGEATAQSRDQMMEYMTDWECRGHATAAIG